MMRPDSFAAGGSRGPSKCFSASPAASKSQSLMYGGAVTAHAPPALSVTIACPAGLSFTNAIRSGGTP